MEVPLQITFRNMPVSDAVDAKIRERAAALEKFFPDIVACKVVVESAARGQRKGRVYYLRIALTVPGREIVAKRHAEAKHSHEDIYVAVRDAFDEIRRQLEDYSRRLKGMVKTPHGSRP